MEGKLSWKTAKQPSNRISLFFIFLPVGQIAYGYHLENRSTALDVAGQFHHL